MTDPMLRSELGLTRVVFCIAERDGRDEHQRLSQSANERRNGQMHVKTDRDESRRGARTEPNLDE